MNMDMLDADILARAVTQAPQNLHLHRVRLQKPRRIRRERGARRSLPPFP